MIKDFFQILTACAGYLSGREWFVVLFVAILLGGLCWLCCAYYTKLWHKRFHVKAPHHVICGFAAILTVVFAIWFYAVRYIEPLVCDTVAEWEEVLIEDNDWAHETFVKTFYAVKEVDPSSFWRVREPEQGGNIIPLNSMPAIQTYVRSYVDEACNSFSTEYPFLNRLLKVKSGISEEIITTDIQTYFENVSDTYPSEQAIDLAATYIESELVKQAPSTVRKTRTILFLLFILVQAIPFSIIGYVAYRDLKLQKF